MILRFIGTDGSMGLQNNRIYEVKVNFLQNEIWIEVYAGFFQKVYCPYETINAFAKNWALVK